MTKQFSHTLLFALIFSVLTLSSCSQVKQVGYFMGIGKTSKPIDLKPLKSIKSSLTTQTNWQVNTGSAMGENQIHPFIDAQVIYIAGARSASAYNKSNGKSLWKVGIGETISAGVNGNSHSSKKASRTQQIFLGTSNGNAISLDAKTGKILWIERLSSEVLAVSPSSNGRIAFRTSDGKIVGLSSTTGELIWQRSQRPSKLSIIGASVPILAGPYVISGFDNGKVAAYDLQTGQPAWEVTLALPRGNTDLERIVDIDGKLSYIGNALFASSLNGSASGINVKEGKPVWLKTFSSTTGVTANSEGLYSSDNKGVIWKLNPQTGAPVWSIDDLEGYQPTLPVLVNNTTILIADKKGGLHWVNAKTGQFVARSKGDPRGYSVAPKVVGKSVYTIGKGGILSRISIR